MDVSERRPERGEMESCEDVLRNGVGDIRHLLKEFDDLPAEETGTDAARFRIDGDEACGMCRRARGALVVGSLEEESFAVLGDPTGKADAESFGECLRDEPVSEPDGADLTRVVADDRLGKENLLAIGAAGGEPDDPPFDSREFARGEFGYRANDRIILIGTGKMAEKILNGRNATFFQSGKDSLLEGRYRFERGIGGEKRHMIQA